MTVVGLDLSLSSTGWATSVSTGKIKPKAVRADAPLAVKVGRLRGIGSRVLELLVEFSPTHVVVEGPSYGSVGGHEHERGGLWWRIADHIEECGIELLVATPTMIKKYATGKGNAGKDDVLAACVRRFEWFKGGNDESDALWACAMGYEYLGQPLLQMPQASRDALKTWQN